MKKENTYIWALIEFTNGYKKWYCISRVLRNSLLIERENNRFWKNKMIGNFITVSKSKYHNKRANLTVGKITKLNISSHRTSGWNWTRNQFITPEHLLDFRDAYNYLKHDYSWYNRFSIWMALRIWHNEILANKNRKLRKTLNQKRHQIRQTNYQATHRIIRARLSK